MTAQKLDLVELSRSAFMAGFRASSEGYNGEYPFDKDLDGIARELEEVFQEYLGEPVEASPFAPAVDGMTLRDWFAGQALAGLASDPDIGWDFEGCIKRSYIMADAMLAAREVQP